MRMAVLAWLLVVALAASVACDLGEDVGPGPDNPGTVVARVTEESGAPLRDVWVYVHDVPNHVGSTYSIGVPTDAGGRAVINAVTAGSRRVEVKPPSGYTMAQPVSHFQRGMVAQLTIRSTGD